MTLRLNGSTSGYVELDAPAVAGTTALALPATSGTVATQAYVDTAEADAIAAGGLQLITTQTFSAVSSVSVNNCFTSTYGNYRVVVAHTGTDASTVALRLRFRVSGSDNTSSLYSFAGRYDATTGEGRMLATNQTSAIVGDIGNTNCGVVFDVLSPNQSARTLFMSQASAWGTSQGSAVWSNGVFFADTVFDGFTLYPGSGTTTGTIRVYGYKD